MARLNVALLGAGIFATTAHLPAIYDLKSFDLKAIYSRSRASADRAVALARALINPDRPSLPDAYYDIDDSKNVHETNGIRSILERGDIAAVIVALPIMEQPKIIRAALKHGKHVLSEKPIASISEEGRELINFYRSECSHLIWSVTECFRSEPAFEYAADQVRQLGRVSFFTFTWATEMQESNAYYQTAWRKDPKHQGGFLLEGGVHCAAELQQILGEQITSVAAFGQQVKSFLPPVDTISSICQLNTGAAGTFTLSAAASQTIHELVVVCEKGTVLVKTTQNSADQETAPVAVVTPTVPTGKEFEFCGVKAGIAAFAEEVFSGKPDILSMPEEALQDVLLIEALLKSARSGGKWTPMPDSQGSK